MMGKSGNRTALAPPDQATCNLPEPENPSFRHCPACPGNPFLLSRKKKMGRPDKPGDDDFYVFRFGIGSLAPFQAPA
jgi:hypothetical protein